MKKILIIIICMFLCGCGYDEYDMPDDVVLITNENKYKIFTNLNIKDLIKESNVELINKDEHVTNNLIGDHIATVEYPIKVIGDNYVVIYTPSKDEEIKDENKKDIMRICDTFDDFKEKLMILYDGYNDIIIEFIKEFLVKQMDEDMKSDLKEIRYDGDNEENLIFYLRGCETHIGCGKYFYDELLKKSKLKKVNKCVLIDFNTYHNYFRLR